MNEIEDFQYMRARVIQELVNYAFADVTDYVEFYQDENNITQVRIRPDAPLDNYVQIKITVSGFSVSCPMRSKALKWLGTLFVGEELEKRDTERDRVMREMKLSVQMMVTSTHKKKQLQRKRA